jgi:hypothetical protein
VKGSIRDTQVKGLQRSSFYQATLEHCLSNWVTNEALEVDQVAQGLDLSWEPTCNTRSVNTLGKPHHVENVSHKRECELASKI